ncbi:hypothetical protein BX666DRAFT_1936695 [Dichotomocladium elegans]|nr:hypothetical protein BX666DRAFT_1936695 [Dichotomocladium elegans]
MATRKKTTRTEQAMTVLIKLIKISGMAMSKNTHCRQFPQTTTEVASRSESFVTRLSSIPIIQDGMQNAQKTLEGHMLGRLAGRTLWSLFERARPYVEQEQAKWQTQIEMANAFGHRSLDAVEQRFPLIINGSRQDLKMAPKIVADEIRAMLSQTVRQLRTPESIGLAMDNLEAMLDQYFPGDEVDEGSDVLIDPKDGARISVSDDSDESRDASYYHIHRMYRIANSLSSRIARKIVHQLQADTDISVSDWLAGHSQQVIDQLEHFNSQLPEPIQHHVVMPLIRLAQREMEIIRLEVEKPGLSPVERAKNILAVSQNHVVMPLLQRSVQSMRNQVIYYKSLAQENKAHVMNELSAKVPVLGHVAPISAFASQYYRNSQPEEAASFK